MHQTAENVYQLDDHRPVLKADTKEGFIMLASTINAELGKFGTYKLNGRERALIDCVIQKTFGFKKKTDWISESQFAEFMGLSEGTTGNINKIKRALIKRKILIEDGRKVGINTVISEWVPYQNQSKTTETKTSQIRLENQSNSTREQSKTTEKPVKFDPHKRKETNTKETIQKKSKFSPCEITLPSFLPRQLFAEFVQHRKDIKKPMSELACTKLINQLTKDHAKGLDVIEAINESIVSGWAGVFPKTQKGQRSNPAPENFSQKDYGEIEGSF